MVSTVVWPAFHTAVCGHPHALDQTTFGRHLCLHRFKLWWLKPSHGNAGLDLPPETSLLLAERYPHPLSPPSSNLQPQPSQYVALLPVSDTYARSALHRAGCRTSGDHDQSDLAMSADTGDCSVPLPGTLGVLFVAVGEDPFGLVRRLVGEATARLRKQLGSGGAEGGAKKGTEATVAGFVDTFGWCTWDSFYTMVTAEGEMPPTCGVLAGVICSLGLLYTCGLCSLVYCTRW